MTYTRLNPPPMDKLLDVAKALYAMTPSAAYTPWDRLYIGWKRVHLEDAYAALLAAAGVDTSGMVRSEVRPAPPRYCESIR